MPRVTISSLRDSQDVTGFFMVRSRQLRQFRERVGSFLIVKLADKTGEIEAKAWENGNDYYWMIKEDDVVKVSGYTQTHNGTLEMAITRLRLAREDEYRLADFLPVSERNIESMIEELRQIIVEVGDPSLSRLLGSFFSGDYLKSFAQAPAAKRIHHACLGGLLEHTIEVVRFCQAAQRIYPLLDRDLLLSGALLHDVGKTREYEYKRSIDFSDEGRLLGHIALGEEMVVREASKIFDFPPDTLTKLRHMILSHHGQYEWQSPKRPKTIEACVLHQADYFSGQVAIFAQALKDTAGNDSGWTAYNKFLDRSVFVGDSLPRPAGCEDVDNHRRVMEAPLEGYFTDE
ncbi:MAG: HD domain-containing protein [Chloroflexi bacterium]|nr:HD domain-containing protein [Chloroflexota bacterium]